MFIIIIITAFLLGFFFWKKGLAITSSSSKEELLGLSIQRPIILSTSHLVESRAGAMVCTCGKAWRYVDEHEIEYSNKVAFRVARTRCRQCGKKQNFYFKIDSQL